MQIGVEATEIILSSTMPKFIWVGIFTNLELLKQSKADGLVLLDATESNFEDASILMVTPKGITTYYSQEPPSTKYVVYNLNVDSFHIFANNLKNS